MNKRDLEYKALMRFLLLTVMITGMVSAFAWDLNSGPINIRKDFHPKYRCEYNDYCTFGRIMPYNLHIFSYDENQRLAMDENYYVLNNGEGPLKLHTKDTYRYDQYGRIMNHARTDNEYTYEYQQNYNDDGQTIYKKLTQWETRFGQLRIKYEEEYYDFEYDNVVKNKVLGYKYRKFNRYSDYNDSTTRGEKKSIVYRNNFGNVDSVYTWHYSRTEKYVQKFPEIGDITKYKEKSRLYIYYDENNKATEITYLEREGSDINNISDQLNRKFAISNIEWYKTNGQLFDLTNPYVGEDEVLHLDTTNLIRAGFIRGYATSLSGESQNLWHLSSKEISYTTELTTGEITGIDFDYSDYYLNPPSISILDNHGGYSSNAANILVEYDDFGEIIRHNTESTLNTRYLENYYKEGDYDTLTGIPKEYKVYHRRSNWTNWYYPENPNGFVRFENPFESSVEEITKDGNGKPFVHYFTLSGSSIGENQLSHGIYIKVTNGKAEKVRY